MSRPSRLQMGVDVGGTTIKAAVVDLDSGAPIDGVAIAATPLDATPEAVVEMILSLAGEVGWDGPIGCALPGIVEGEALLRAPNLADAWALAGTTTMIVERLGVGSELLNDADAAGLSELHYGPQGGLPGLTILLTFGTGIGSALLHAGSVIKNSELGELLGNAGTFEDVASARVVSAENLSPDEWANRAQPYFGRLERLLNPARWIVSGGLSSAFDHYFQHLDLRRPMRVAHLGEHAGVVGAAVAVGGAE